VGSGCIGVVLGREQGLQSGEVGRISAGQPGIGLREVAEGKGKVGWDQDEVEGSWGRNEGLRSGEGGRGSYGRSWCQGEEMKCGRGSGEE